MKKPNVLQEQDGAWSSRRLLAVVSFANAVALSWSAVDWHVVALFLGATLVLLGLTTVSDLRGINYPAISDGSRGVKMGAGLPELRQNSDTKLTDLDGKVDKASTTMTGANTSDAPGSYEYRRWE